MKNYKTKIQRMSCETIATVGMRVIETITQSMAEDVKNSLYATQLLEVTNRYRKAIEPNDKERNAAISDKFNIRKVLFSNSYDMAYGLTLSRDAGDKEAAITVSDNRHLPGVTPRLLKPCCNRSIQQIW